MKKSFLGLFLLLFAFSTFAQRTEHSDRNLTLTIGSGLPIVQKSMLQFEHSLGSNWAIGENIAYHYGLLGATQIWSGPKLEFLGRYYFTDQTIKHGGNWFAQIKGGAAFLTNPLASVDGFDENMELFIDTGGVNPIPYINPATGERVKIFQNGNNWISAGGGISIGYKKITCKGWVWEAFIGYHYWSTPNYFTEEFEAWVEDPINVYDTDANIIIDDIENGTDYLWNLTYGFPVDLQFKVGKILNW
tara:strand:- start:6303 stop:7040 length:738 start_codon:yes stop_codon:yes gene_type:complete